MRSRSSRRATLAGRHSGIVIEGFERSGNTFSVAAFIIANGPDIHIGRHLHAAAHVLRAARHNIPTIVLIRDPRDVVLSYLVRYDRLTPDDALLAYTDFYRSAWRVRDQFVIASFDQVKSDFGRVIETVNERFGTRFDRYQPGPENQRLAFGLVEDMNRLECRGEVIETHVGRPSHERDVRKTQLTSLLDRPKTAAKLARAQRLYDTYVTEAAAYREADPDT